MQKILGRGIMEVTLEMGCEKTTHKMQTNSLYNLNKNAFFNFLEKSLFSIIFIIFYREKGKIYMAYRIRYTNITLYKVANVYGFSWDRYGQIHL